jgi:hypothetical protein
MENYNIYQDKKNKINWRHILIAAVFTLLIDRGVLVWQNSQNAIPEPINNNTEEGIKNETPQIIPGETITPADSITKNFSSPHPLAWQEAWNNGKQTVDYTLTKISLGKRTAPPQLKKPSGDYYETGEEISALTMYFKIKTNNWNDSSALCIKPSLRRLINEAGELSPPDNQEFYSSGMKMNCAGSNKIYLDQEAIFVVPENEKEFTFTTGGKSNIFFSIINSNGNLNLEKAPTSESGN